MPSFTEIFDSATDREVAGNKPLLLDNPEDVWLVASGKIDVFATTLEKGELTGPRTFVMSVEPGSMMFGMGPAQGEMPAFIAVGTSETRVSHLTRTALQAHLQDKTVAAHAARLVDRWIDRLSMTVAGKDAGKNVHLLQASRGTAIPPGKRVSPAHGTLWISSPAAASVRFLDHDDLTLNGAQDAFPLAASAWITAEGQTKLSAVRTEAAMSDGGIWPALERFHAAIAFRTEANAAEAALAEQSRLDRRSRSELLVAQTTVSNLANVIEEIRSDGFAGSLDDDPLIAAFQLVGARLGVQINAPPSAGKNVRDPILAISHASRVRMRRVVLAPEWWTRDNGPLVAFAEDDRPVALLPLGPDRYELVDPAERKRETVTEEVAARLYSEAYCIYRPFPPERIGIRDILKTGLGGTRREWVRILLMGAVGGILGMLVPIATGMVFGEIVPSENRTDLLFLSLALIVGTLVSAILQFTQGIAMLRVETRMDGSVESALWDRLLNLPASFFRDYAAGDLAMRGMAIGRIRQVLTEAAISSSISLAFSLMAVGLLFWYDSRLAWLAMLIFVLIFVATIVTAFVQLKYERKNYHIRGKVAGIVLQMVTGISRLRVAGAENRAVAYWAKHFSEQMRLSFAAESTSIKLAVLMAAVPAISAMLIYAAAGWLLPVSSLSLASFLAFNAAFVQVISAAISMSSTITSILEIVPLYERARPILKATPESHAAHRAPGELNGDIEISHVSFRYQPDGPLILDDLCVHARPGEFVALVGPSGAGKSTILRLLLGFENPTSGSIYFDREELTGLDLQAVRRQLGVVLQNSRITSGDLFTSITGGTGFTLDDAWEAAKMAGLAEEIDRLPMGMYTVITDGESTFSGGQRQRLMIARAVVAKPKILIFDEATSALDNVTQAKVSKSLNELKATRIVVAHRLSTVMHADRIYVIERGKVVQQGRYEELIKQPGLFSDLAKRQLV